MKKIKNFLRVWIAGASVAGFIFGWATFAHSNKPLALTILQSQAPATSSSVLTLTNNTASNSTQTGLQIVQQPQSSRFPRLRTGGS